MIFTVPIRTVSALNMREHWALKARRVKRERRETACYCLANMKALAHYIGAAEAGVRLDVTLTRVAPSSGLDDDNLRGALKGVRDEIADALGVDDRDPVVAWRYGQRRGKAKEWGVEVTVEESTGAP